VLTEYNWPGNVRQVENIIERATILDTDGVIDTNDLPSVILTGNEVVQNEPQVVSQEVGDLAPLRRALQEPEKVYILKVLKEVGWNKKQAAKKLGVNRTTLYNKLRKHNIVASAKV